MPRHPKGIRRWGKGWQAYVRVNGRLYAESFPLTTSLETMQAWRETTRSRHQAVHAISGSFAQDIEVYLSRVSAMPSFAQRRAHLMLWADALGRDRPRSSITTDEIDQVMQYWLSTRPAKAQGRAGGRPVVGTGLGAGTVRKRRTALLSLFHKLDGRHAANAVRASQAPREPKPEARGLDYETIARILDGMQESGAKRRLTVIAYTGLPPSLLKAVAPTDVNLRAGTVRVRPRRKGAGVEARTLSLLPQGVEAFRAFAAANAWGSFNNAPINRSFQLAAEKAGVTGVTLYDLRHSFLSMLYTVTKDIATVARFGLHSNIAMTTRYTHLAMRGIDTDAAAQAGQFLEKSRLA